jgi:hypothetical protein
MAGCYPTNACHHVDGEFCDRCYKPQSHLGITPQFDEVGNEWCVVCQTHSPKGHTHRMQTPKAYINKMVTDWRQYCKDNGINLEPLKLYPHEKPEYPDDFVDALKFYYATKDCDQCEINDELIERIEKLEKQGTDINLRLIHDAVTRHIENFNKRIMQIENDIKSLRSFYADYGHRLLNIENAFTEEDVATKPATLMDQFKRCNNKLDKLTNRVDHIDKVLRDPFRNGEKNIPDDYDERISGIEEMGIEKRLITIENFIGQNYEADIERLEGHLCVELARFQTKLAKIDKVNVDLVDKIAAIGNHYYRERQQPFVCPLCDGKGKVTTKLKAPQEGKIDGVPINEGDAVLHINECPACQGGALIWK